MRSTLISIGLGFLGGLAGASTIVAAAIYLRPEPPDEKPDRAACTRASQASFFACMRGK